MAVTLFCIHIGEQQFGRYAMDDRASMSTDNSQYMGNQQFRPPVHIRGVETIINPAADRESTFDDQTDHLYNDPFEMNAAQAQPHFSRPVTPRPTTIPNMHYGAPMGNGIMGSSLPPEPAGPLYQDPDELASVSLYSYCLN
jgi:hypothetical protein